MSVADSSQYIGWAHEATPETDAINDGSALYWAFGVKTTEIKGSHPKHIVDYRPVYKNQLYPSDSERVATHGTGAWAYFPVNGVPLYLLFGGSTSVDGVHTLGGTSNIIGHGGVQPIITVRSESTGATDDKFISAKGARIQSVENTISFISDWPYLTEAITYNAIKTEAADHASSYAPKYPTDNYLMNGTQRTGRYEWGRDATNQVFTWNSNDFRTSLVGMTITNVIHHKLGRIHNQTELEYIDPGKFQFLFTITFFRGNVKEIWDDYIAGTQRTMVFKIYNDATNGYYRQYTWTNATLITCDAPYEDAPSNNTWTVSGYSEQLEVVVKDGCSDSFYDD